MLHLPSVHRNVLTSVVRASSGRARRTCVAAVIAVAAVAAAAAAQAPGGLLAGALFAAIATAVYQQALP